MRTFIYSVVAAATMALAGISSAFAQGHIIIVNANAPGVGFNDPTPAAPVGGNTGTTLGEQRLNVFAFAANIWEQTLQPRTDIFVIAQFAPLGPNVLGSAGATFVFRNFPGAEYPDTWYTSAEADHLNGADLNPGFADIQATFATGFPFYFGFDGNEGPLTDLLPVVLHELGHGLGFANFANEATGTLFQGGKDIYSQYTVDVTTNKLWNDMTDAERQASAINVRKVSWSGINVKKDVPKVLSPGEPFVRINGASPQLLSFGTAAFGAALTPAGITGDVALVNDGVGATTDACEPIPAGSLTGKIALLDRGVCTFVVKVKNAQDAGAIAVLAADNVLADPPAGLGGADPTITIPSGRITLPAGNAIKAALATGTVNVTLGLDMSILAGTDRVKGLMMVAALNPVALGSSISHWDTAATRNQLMEPAINVDLTSTVTPPIDLTSSQMTDIGWFSDGDGVPDGVDNCIGSDTRPTVVIGTCNSKAGNDVQTNGCTIADDVDQCAIDFPKKPLHYLACVAHKTDDLRVQRVITAREQVGILTCTILNGLRH
jgi:PA domain-containing protein